jgi:hypothetical protein
LRVERIKATANLQVMQFSKLDDQYLPLPADIYAHLVVWKVNSSVPTVNARRSPPDP